MSPIIDPQTAIAMYASLLAITQARILAMNRELRLAYQMLAAYEATA